MTIVCETVILYYEVAWDGKLTVQDVISAFPGFIEDVASECTTHILVPGGYKIVFDIEGHMIEASGSSDESALTDFVNLFVRCCWSRPEADRLVIGYSAGNENQ